MINQNQALNATLYSKLSLSNPNISSFLSPPSSPLKFSPLDRTSIKINTPRSEKGLPLLIVGSKFDKLSEDNKKNLIDMCPNQIFVVSIIIIIF